MADLSPIHSGLGPVPRGERPPDGLSQLFAFFRVDWDRHFYAPHGSCLPHVRSSIRWVIPCSHVRVFARRLGR